MDSVDVDVQRCRELMELDGHVTMYHPATDELWVHEQQLGAQHQGFTDHVLSFHFVNSSRVPTVVRRTPLCAFYDVQCPAMLHAGFRAVDPMTPLETLGQDGSPRVMARWRLYDATKLKLQVRFRATVAA